MLTARVGMDRINGYMKSLGLTGTSIKRKIFDFDAMDRGEDNATTPGDMKKLFLILSTRAASDPGAREMLFMLKSVERKDMLPSRLPGSVAVAHKTGELSGLLLDTGIVYYPPAPYILCLMGKEITDRDKAVRDMAELSLHIYEAIVKDTAGTP
jgi:beta-lactamase class A